MKTGSQENEGLTEEFFVRYRTTDQETRKKEEGVKVSNEHQDSAPALALIDTKGIFTKSAPPTVLEGILGSMSDQAKKELATRQKVSNEHKTKLLGLARKDTFKARLDEEIDVIFLSMPTKDTSTQKRRLSPAAHKDAGAGKRTHKEEEEAANGGNN